MNAQTQTLNSKFELSRNAEGRAPLKLDSAALLGNCSEVEITHQGQTYRLRLTRQGKLILTK